jgi:hypothetical protein
MTAMTDRKVDAAAGHADVGERTVIECSELASSPPMAYLRRELGERTNEQQVRETMHGPSLTL